MSLLRSVLRPTLIALACLTPAGCVVEARPYAVAAPPCPGGRWIAGHYGPYGRWHRAHWACPGVVEVVEVQ